MQGTSTFSASLVYNASFDDALGLGGACVLMDLMNSYVSNFPEHVTSTVSGPGCNALAPAG
jgi:hypothetical protein